MEVVSPFLPFAPVSWWGRVVQAEKLQFDASEHFQKMTLRNKYHVSGSNNVVNLTVPLEQGRGQRTPMHSVAISNAVRWQVQHWRTLASVYGRTPYWEHLHHELQPLFEKQYQWLQDFCLDTTYVVLRLLNLTLEIDVSNNYLKHYPAHVIDLRNSMRSSRQFSPSYPRYYQVFEDRVGFQPDLSIIDLLFSEGLGTAAWLRANGAAALTSINSV
jgi:hypothetical protein